MKRTSNLLFRLIVGFVFLAAVFETPNVYAGIRIGIGIPLPFYTSPPPTPVYVAPPPAPGPDYVWIPGQYQWNGYQWVWYPGYYAYQPYPDAVWVGGYWGYSGGARVWVGGHWGHRH